MGPRAFGSGPRSVLPGKFADDGTSSHFTGNVVASLPEGGVRPVQHVGDRVARLLSRLPGEQDGVGPLAPARGLDHAADVQDHEQLLLLGVERRRHVPAAASSRRRASSKSSSRLRSRNSPELRPIVTSATSVSRASRAISSAGTVISAIGVGGMNGRVGAGRFASCSLM